MNIIESNLKWNGSLSYSNIPLMLVLHHAEASKCTIEDIHNWHLDNKWIGCGYHFLVRKDGTIYRGRPENAIGAHCPGANDKSVGICAEGSYASEIMPKAQREAIIELGRYLCSKYPIKQVYGHKELYSTNCPGTNYPLESIKINILNPIIERKVDNMSILDFQKFFNTFNIPGVAKLVEDGIDGPKTQGARTKLKAIFQYVLA